MILRFDKIFYNTGPAGMPEGESPRHANNVNADLSGMLIMLFFTFGFHPYFIHGTGG